MSGTGTSGRAARADRDQMTIDHQADSPFCRVATSISSHPQAHHRALQPSKVSLGSAPASDRKDFKREGKPLVGMTGFEPATPTPPVWCATRLRYIPKPVEAAL